LKDLKYAFNKDLEDEDSPPIIKRNISSTENEMGNIFENNILSKENSNKNKRLFNRDRKNTKAYSTEPTKRRSTIKKQDNNILNLNNIANIKKNTTV
jgi:uncharacterized protein YqgQ